MYFIIKSHISKIKVATYWINEFCSKIRIGLSPFFLFITIKYFSVKSNDKVNIFYDKITKINVARLKKKFHYFPY